MPSQADSDFEYAANVIERAADDAAAEIVSLRTEVARWSGEADELRGIAESRQSVIDDLLAQTEMYHQAADDRAHAIAALDDAVRRERAAREQLQADLDRISRERDSVKNAADTAARASREERARAGIAAQEREAALRSLRRDAQEIRARNVTLEDALLARTQVIDELQHACDERLALIERLSHEIGVLREAADQRAAAGGASERDGVDWRAVAEERERALVTLSAEAERRAVLLADLTAALEGRSQELEVLRLRSSRNS